MIEQGRSLALGTYLAPANDADQSTGEAATRYLALRPRSPAGR